jgi:hypothetical protein
VSISWITLSQILTLKLSDQVFAEVQRQAKIIGVSPEHLAATLIEKKFTQSFKSLLTDVEKETAQAKFEHQFGTSSSTIEVI